MSEDKRIRLEEQIAWAEHRLKQGPHPGQGKQLSDTEIEHLQSEIARLRQELEQLS